MNGAQDETAFEAYIRSEWPTPDRSLEKQLDGTYFYPSTRVALEAWQAAASVNAKEIRALKTHLAQLRREVQNAKTLVRDLHTRYPRTRETIEKRTGFWLVFGEEQ